MNSNIKLTLLTKEQLFGRNKLEVLKQYGTQADATALSSMKGGSHFSCYYQDKEFYNTMQYFTRTPDGHIDEGFIVTVDEYGERGYNPVGYADCGIRPVLITDSILFEEITKKEMKSYNDAKIVEFLSYPQSNPGKEMQFRLEIAREDNELEPSGYFYTFNSTGLYDEKEFKPVRYKEYIYKGKRYIRAKKETYDENADLYLGYYNDNYKNVVWFEVEPVQWLIDYKEKLLIAKKCLSAGIPIDHTDEYNPKYFKNCDCKMYLDNYMLPELIQGTDFEKNNHNKSLVLKK